MLPVPRAIPQRSLVTISAWRRGAAALALLLAGVPLGAAAQDAPPAAADRGEDQPIGFEADGVSYDDNSETVTAFGNVVMRRGDQSVVADQLTWNRQTGKIEATGNIRMVDADGNQLFTDKIELTEEFKAGAMQNMLLALREGGRLA